MGLVVVVGSGGIMVWCYLLLVSKTLYLTTMGSGTTCLPICYSIDRTITTRCTGIIEVALVLVELLLAREVHG